MSDDRLPKQVFYSQLKEGKRIRGGQKKRYKDVLKANMKKCNIDFNNWEDIAKDRPLWRATIRVGATTFETKRCEELEEKRRRRKERQQHQRLALPPGTRCPHCNRSFRARIGLISHLRTHSWLPQQLFNKIRHQFPRLQIPSSSTSGNSHDDRIHKQNTTLQEINTTWRDHTSKTEANSADNGEGTLTNTNTKQYKTRQLNEHLH